MSKSSNEIELRSEEVQELLSKPPHWIISWGNALFFFLILLVLILSWLVKYPDIISAEALITTRTPPQKEFAVITSKIDSIYIEDLQAVQNGEILAVLENTANTNDVFFLKSILDTIDFHENLLYFPIEEMPILFLGDIDENYAYFENSYTNYLLNKRLNPFSNEVKANKASITELKGRLASLKSQYLLNESEFNLKKAELERNKELHKKGVISDQEFESKKRNILVAERSLENSKVPISQTREAISNAKRTFKGAEIRRTIEEQQLIKTVIQSYSQLKRSVKEWENKYVFKSEIEGRVSFLNYWDENQTVTQGDLVFTIIPTKNLNYVAKLKAQPQNSGKIKVGQQVNLKLYDYPESEFGFLTGNVEKISLSPNKEGNYLIDVSLPKPLVTSYNMQVEFRQEMRSEADIITEDLRLMERFFYQFKQLIAR